jgi:uncharacterized protein
MSRLLLLFVMFVQLAAPAAAGPLEDGRAALEKKDYAVALKILQPLADQGDAYAQDLIGAIAYERNDYATALKIFRPRAEKGEAYPQYMVGYMYETGHGVALDDAAAVMWYRRAAERGSWQAQLVLGHRSRMGRGVPQDQAVALAWFRKAAAQGDNNAQFMIGYMAYEKQDYATALRIFRPLADRGYVYAQDWLGYLYERGQGVAVDKDAAMAWYGKAAKQGSVSAQYGSGVIAYEKKDYATAREMLQPLADRGDADARRMVGNVERQQGPYATALMTLQPLADRGDAEAQYKLGRIYEEGKGVRASNATALTWYRKAAEQGNADAQVAMGRMYSWGLGVQKDYVESMRWLRKAADQGNAFAQTAVGNYYRRGHVVPQDYAMALKWYRLAADQGWADAEYILGEMYSNGEGVAQDDAEAMKWFSKATDKGRVDAQKRIGRQPAPTFAAVEDLFWSDGQFIAVGRDGLVLTSTDGSEWSAQRTSGLLSLKSVTRGAGQFAALTDSAVLTSTDGRAWTERLGAPPGTILKRIAWTGDRFIVVGGGGFLATSPDGIEWTRRVSGTNENLEGIAHGGGRFVVVGNNSTVTTSDDGVAWTAARIVSPPGKTTIKLHFYEWRRVVWNGRVFVAVAGWGDQWGAVAASADGSHWDAKTFTGGLRDVVWSHGRFVAVGADIVVSDDGTDWTFLRARWPGSRPGYGSLELRHIAANDDAFVAVSRNGPYTSNDGVTWHGGLVTKMDVAPGRTPTPATTVPNDPFSEAEVSNISRRARARADFVTSLTIVGLVAYPFLQWVAIRRMKGGWRWLAYLPLLVMAGSLVRFAVGAYLEQNLIFLLPLFVVPPVFVYLVALHIAHAGWKWLRGARPRVGGGAETGHASIVKGA